jgi:hypothetical protein
MSHVVESAVLMARIEMLERQAAKLDVESTPEDVRGKVTLLLASLQGARAALGTAPDDSIVLDTERIVDAVSQRVLALERVG